MDESKFAALLGHAALKVWPELSRDAQEMLFAAAVDDGVIANTLATYLHDHHPPDRPSAKADGAGLIRTCMAAAFNVHAAAPEPMIA